MLGPAEPLQADDARRPGAEARLARETLDDGVGRKVVQPLEVDRAAEPDESGRAAGVEAELAQLGRPHAAEALTGGRLVQAAGVTRRRAPDHIPLDLLRVLPGDELPGQRSQERVRDGREVAAGGDP